MNKVKEANLADMHGTGSMVSENDAKLEVANPAEANGDVDLSPFGIGAKLLHTLDIYPQISPSMLQIAMNPLKAGDWQPTLEYLIREGKIHRLHFSSTSSAGRSITYTLIRAVDPHGVLNTVTRLVLEQSPEAITPTLQGETEAVADPLED